MYKVLVTTYYDRGNGGDRGVAVHTVVIEFGNAEDAAKAADIVNKRAGSVVMGSEQRAVLLFEHKGGW